MNSSIASSRSAYDSWHEQLAVDTDTDTPWHRLLKSNLIPERDLAGKRVLEIACGRGGFACWLATQSQRPDEVFAADFSPAAINKGQAFAVERGISGIRWEVQDIQSLSYAASEFDTVISSETIEHVPDSRRALSELVRVLKPGGRLFLTTPNYLGLMGLYRIYMRMTGRRFTEEGQPINHFLLLPRTRAWVLDSGLNITKVDATGHYLPFPGRPPIACPQFERPRVITRWFGLHSLIVAEKRCV